ncbi:MAG TPA: T9SS type A sorting domain-containing protein, partial [Bacteroidia bacterium]|nr:T9SS type A sorting domain-containing protein [Bacteroidia bacterium]
WADIGTTVSNNTVNDWDQQIYISGVGGRSGSASGFQSFTLYDETLASNNYANVGNTSTPIVPAVGYTLWLADAANPATWIAKNLACDGSPNSGSVTSPNLTYTAGSTDPGENHLANPYASHITWDASGTNITKSGNVDLSTIYVISNGNYVSHGNGFDLPAGQGFIVYSTAAGTNNITFTQACKNVATSSTFDFRETAPYNLKLKLSTAALPEFFHEISVNFDENATLGFESPYDARFIPSPEKTAPSLCMIQNGKRLTRNTFNSSAYETIQIPVKCMIGLDGTYTLEAFGAYSMTDYSCALLEDIHTHQIIDLKKTAAYSFAAKTTDNPDRFILHLSRSSQQCEQILASAKPADLFFSDNQVTVFNTPEGASVAFDLDQDTPAILSVYNVQGQKVVSDQNVVAFKNKIDLSLPSDASGMYILTVNLNGGHLVTKKIFFHH